MLASMGAKRARAVCLTLDATQPIEASDAAALLSRHGVPATFFVSPAALVGQVAFWRHLAACGHEVADGTLLAASDVEGRLPRWTLEMVGHDLEESGRLWAEVFGPGCPRTVAVPFGERTAHAGADYMPVVIAHGAPVWASDSRLGVAVWAAGRALPSDVPEPGLNAVELARGADNRLAWRDAAAADWARWASELPTGVVTTFAQAWSRLDPGRVVRA
jgi:peptidoglycan/xylan/chitin deacetylase (PgdA/CDA1 family)